jgi:glycosyltransferase involved in cell wall biosynthesis
VLSLEAWDDVWRRNQFLVRELLARDAQLRVLFVEPPFDRIHELRRRNGRTRQRGLRHVRPDGRVLALEPVKILSRAIGRFADRSLRRQVLAAIDEIGFDTPTVWINDASFSALVNIGWPTVYDITDDWLLASGPPRVMRRLAHNEARLLQRSDVVVVCSPALAESRRTVRTGIHLVPNAVDVEHFAIPQARPADLPAGPVAVYVGTLHEDRIDVDLVERVATDLPDLEFVFVGPNSLNGESVARFERHNNITLLGARPYDDVPGYLQHADVIVVPHVVSPFTESLDPIKAYECLAVGRPTVATPVAGFRDMGAPIVVADPSGFSSAVEAARRANDVVASGVVASSVLARDVPDWKQRGEEFERALHGARARRGVA